MKADFSTVFVGLSKGDFLETDGISYWWISEGSYREITQKLFKEFARKKLIYGKKIDDETTCFCDFFSSACDVNKDVFSRCVVL